IWTPPGLLATRSAVTLPIPIQLSVSVSKSMRANVTVAPLVSVRPRWHSCSSTSRGSARQRFTTSSARSAAVSAALPWPSPSATPNSAAVPPTSTAIGKSPHTSSPGTGRRAAAHSIGPIHPLLRTGRNSLPHFYYRAFAGRRFHNQPVHQSSRTRQAKAKPTARRVAVLERALDVDDARAVVLGADHKGLSAVAVLNSYPNLAPPGVTGDVAGDFGNRRGDHRDIGQREADLTGQFVPGLAGGDDVVGVVDVNYEVSRHRRAHSPASSIQAADSAAQDLLRGPAPCTCRRTPARVAPSRRPPPAATRRSPCPRRATGSCGRSCVSTGRRMNPSRRSR